MSLIQALRIIGVCIVAAASAILIVGVCLAVAAGFSAASGNGYRAGLQIATTVYLLIAIGGIAVSLRGREDALQLATIILVMPVALYLSTYYTLWHFEFGLRFIAWVSIFLVLLLKLKERQEP